MSTIRHSIDQIISAAGGARQGLRIARWTPETDENSNQPYELVDGTLIEGDQDSDEVKAAVRRHGYTTETDCDGVVLAGRE